MKKVFNVMMIVLFVGNFFVANSTNFNAIETQQDDHCWDQVQTTLLQAERAGWSDHGLEWLANAALAVHCYGYEWEDTYYTP